ncbi:MAG: aldehyde dehydrogenase family protein [Vicinamibacterales bacterium]|jgi:aldehyde dehydrogenase (NAD+)|nr:aldehyde dehydrogenase family protein [Acidobacteriota bacterium]MDP7294538.1 aldehyde dehydrogenase family protein [Vicinamibacterales bacterium]MDP7473144.1 aldehyde dehydrogenase family protein [Vicinamibacterales bacterium]MDP7670489.1 aldehyde dehydrogenase family protein [Vicinamibacterales bacterium]HJO38147.1 aldehyde dehydrogenase family protein [Vicinamibacterales bacterium]|tara:strand:+ start:5211 stop:6767 length:1557 start_codon:yes stop_codon:yes gene_type:complete
MSDLLKSLGITTINPGGFAGEWLGSGPEIEVRTPIDGSPIASVKTVTEDEYEQIVERAQRAFYAWRAVPAPRRGEVVRQLGDRLRAAKQALGALVTFEMGKIAAEGQGEVQEMIDICDFACGLSRQLYGLTMPSERPDHRMFEQWHPLGVIGVVSAFNFPVAVWSWNAAIGAVCGNSTVWKPASRTPLTAIAVTRIAEAVCRANDVDPATFALTIGGGSTIGERLLHDRRVGLISATGSCEVGHRVAEVVSGRLGRTILELGGNNAIIVTAHANLDLALPAIVFGAVGTAGQRCTSTRRVIYHRSIRDELITRLKRAYGGVRIGDPRQPETLMGPLVSRDAVDDLMRAVARVKTEGGEILWGGECLDDADHPGGHYVTPCVATSQNDFSIVQEETFGPILYLIDYGAADATPAQAVDEIDQAVALQNGVPQGLSSAIFTEHLREAEHFLSARGSDCGIANVNIGTSGAEIGGAFGGEKETGGGRESGSDAWRAYMRRQTNTVNWGTELPLAQGIKFGD